MDVLCHIENLAQQILKVKDKDAAVWSLYELIIERAKKKDFLTAERLREKLIEFDPMALTEIVTSAEIIEEEKTRSRPADHSSIWRDLYATITPEEANALYYSMKEARTLGTEPICVQGERNTNLYFLNEGRWIMVWNQNGKDIAVKTILPGEILGEDSFFSDSFCTASVRTYSHSRFNYLEREALSQWKDQLPALESKLKGYCSGSKRARTIFNQTGLNRRSSRRYRVGGQGMVQLLQDSGRPIHPAFKGELLNVSADGLCFCLRILKRESARLLLGRKMNLKFIVSAGETPIKIHRDGSVVAVQPLSLDDYTVHIKLEKGLNHQIMARLEWLDDEMIEKLSRKGSNLFS